MSSVRANAGLVLILSLVFGATTAPWLAAQSALFAEPLLPVAGAPGVILQLDLDGDGDLDMATLQSSAPQGEILLAGPDGLASHASYTLGTVVADLAAADFNGDGRPDLAVAFGDDGTSGPGHVTVLLNLGGGDFLAQPAIPLGACLRLEAADLDGNGTQDLVVVRDGMLTALLGAGTGAFSQGASYVVPTSLFTDSFVVVDANGDGHPDVALVDAANKVDVLLGTGSGSLGPLTSFATGGNPIDIASADFDENGSVDLITADKSSDTLTLLPGTGTGSFPTHKFHLVGDAPISVAVGDFDEDGHRDAICVNYADSTLSFLKGDGQGHLAAASTIEPGYAPGSVRSADGNSDGHPDLIVMNVDQPGIFAKATGAYWLYGDGAGGFACNTSLDLTVSPTRVIAGDFDEDGRSDVLAAVGAVSLLFARGKGDGTLDQAAFVSLTGASSDFAVADINLDGHLDAVATVGSKDQIDVLLGSGDGTLSLSSTKSTGDLPGGVVVTDLDGDGLPDVVTSNSNSDNISVFRATSHGHLSAATFFATHDGPDSLAAADIDDDGDLDLCVACSDKTALMMLNSGTASFVQGAAVPVAQSAQTIKTADFESDGHPDFADLTPYGELDVLHGLGGGNFSVSPVVSDGYALDLAVFDADGDGHPDLAWTQGMVNSLGLRRGLGDGSFGDLQVCATGFFPRTLDAGDFDSDGRPDLAVGCGDDSQTAALNILPNAAPSAWAKLGPALAGTAGKPALFGTGSLAGGSANALHLVGGKPSAQATLIAGLGAAMLPFKGGTLVPVPSWLVVVATNLEGQVDLPFAMPAGLPGGVTFDLQTWIADPAAAHGLAASNGLVGTTP